MKVETDKNMSVWNSVKAPPKSALKTIKGGRLSGKTDISPQWRYEIMTQVFGACGFGWKFSIEKTWTTEAPDGQVFVFAQVLVLYKQGNTWSDPIQGVGGSMLVAKEKAGLHANDEGFKMAVTDALGTALKMIGVAADIYAGKWDGSKYKDDKDENPKKTPKETPKETQKERDAKRLAAIEQEYFNYTTANEMPEGFEWNKEAFIRIVLEGDPKSPKAIRDIVKNIPSKLIVVEKK